MARSTVCLSVPPTQAEVQALRDKAEELADDVRALSTLASLGVVPRLRGRRPVHALGVALVAEELVKGTA